GAPRPLHDPRGARPDGRAAHRDRRRRSALARRALPDPGARADGRARDARRTAGAAAARDRSNGLRDHHRHRGDRRCRRPLRPAHDGPGRDQDRVGPGGGVMLFARAAPKENVVVRGARVVDPVEGIDAVLDVRVDDGVIAALGTDLDTNSHRVLEGAGLVLAPAFVDPHVHLRTPGREDEESIASGTAAAAAGGYCAILAMPNTEPVVDSAAVLRSLAETAQAEAEVPVGFLAAITRNQAGA